MGPLTWPLTSGLETRKSIGFPLSACTLFIPYMKLWKRWDRDSLSYGGYNQLSSCDPKINMVLPVSRICLFTKFKSDGMESSYSSYGRYNQPWPTLSFKCGPDLQATELVLCARWCPVVANISAKLFQNPLMRDKQMQNRQTEGRTNKHMKTMDTAINLCPPLKA